MWNTVLVNETEGVLERYPIPNPLIKQEMHLSRSLALSYHLWTLSEAVYRGVKCGRSAVRLLWHESQGRGQREKWNKIIIVILLTFVKGFSYARCCSKYFT